MDSEKSITYRLVAGDVDKFVVDPVTGEVTMTKLHVHNSSLISSYSTRTIIFDVLIFYYQVRTKALVGRSTGIDFERQKSHMIIVGTEEERGSFLSSRSGVRRSLDFSDDITVCQIDITVTDENDIAPSFIRAPLGNTITV